MDSIAQHCRGADNGGGGIPQCVGTCTVYSADQQRLQAARDLVRRLAEPTVVRHGASAPHVGEAQQRVATSACRANHAGAADLHNHIRGHRHPSAAAHRQHLHVYFEPLHMQLRGLTGRLVSDTAGQPRRLPVLSPARVPQRAPVFARCRVGAVHFVDSAPDGELRKGCTFLEVSRMGSE
jgi:hypothetical protein